MKGMHACPKWWEIYNGLKHDVGINIEEANLRNAAHSLAGAFLLNVIHILGARRLLKLGLLDLGEISDWQTEEWLKKKKGIYGSISTPVFIYDFSQLEGIDYE